MLVGTVPVERCSVVFATGKQPTLQPIGSRGGHTQRQSQSSGGRHTRAQRNPTPVQDHQCRPGRVRVHESHRFVQSR